MRKSEFYEKCYTQLSKVPRGKVITYKDLAHSIGSKAYRAVGTAMKNNPYAPKVPCHRVIKSNGEIGEFALGRKKKIEMLRKEGILVVRGKINLKAYRFNF